MSIPGSIFTDIETWVRRIVKTSSDQSVTSDTIRNYFNRFYLYHVPERVQLFELKRRYTFSTYPNINYYTFPPRTDQNIPEIDYPIIRPPVYCDGIEIGYFPNDFSFYRNFPEQVFNNTQISGDGTDGPYSLTLSYHPIQRTYHDVQGYFNPALVISALSTSGDTVFLIDGGDGFLYATTNQYQGFEFDAMGDISNTQLGTVDYLTGDLEFSFSANIVDGTPIYFQCLPYSPGRPIAMLFVNNYLKLYPVPDKCYKMDIDSQITPTQFATSDASVPFAYMSEYFARGTARLMLSDSGDEEQLAFYEPLFLEQELFVLRRTSRQSQVTRTPTIFSGQNIRYNPGFPYSQY